MLGKQKYTAKLADRVNIKEPEHMRKLYKKLKAVLGFKNTCIGNNSSLLMNNDFNKE